MLAQRTSLSRLEFSDHASLAMILQAWAGDSYVTSRFLNSYAISCFCSSVIGPSCSIDSVMLLPGGMSSRGIISSCALWLPQSPVLWIDMLGPLYCPTPLPHLPQPSVALFLLCWPWFSLVPPAWCPGHPLLGLSLYFVYDLVQGLDMFCCLCRINSTRGLYIFGFLFRLYWLFWFLVGFWHLGCLEGQEVYCHAKVKFRMIYSMLSRLSRSLKPRQLIVILQASFRPLIQVRATSAFMEPDTPSRTMELPEQEERVELLMGPDPTAKSLKNKRINSPTRLLAVMWAFRIINIFGRGTTQRRMQESYSVRAKKLAACITGKKYLGSTNRKRRLSGPNKGPLTLKKTATDLKWP